MAQPKATIPTVDEIVSLDAALRAKRGGSGDERKAVDDAVRAVVEAEGIDGVYYDKTKTAVTAVTESLELYARVDSVDECLGVVQVCERATDEQITDDVDPAIIGSREPVAKAVFDILDAYSAPRHERAW